MFIKNILKMRKAKNSKRGIYLQDKELIATDFKPGMNFRYITDLKSKKIIILPSEIDTGNTVSKRVVNDGIKPVLDIRSSNALSCFKGCTYLQVSIYKDHIEVEGYQEISEAVTSESLLQKFNENPKVSSIEELTGVKRKAILCISKRELKKASGIGYSVAGQLTLDEWITQNAKSSPAQVIDLKGKLENLIIPLQINSLFSGCGLFDYSFINEGFEVAFAIDMDPGACQTYRLNIGDIVCGDIMEEREIPNSPVTIGGSKCQNYSSSNRRTNYGDCPDDPLIKRFINLVKKNKGSKVFVFENVPEALTAGNGVNLKLFKDQLPDYSITSGILASASMGACQLRERAIIIGSKIGPIDIPKPILTPDEYITVQEAFKGLDDTVPNQGDYTISKPSTVEKMKFVPQGGNVMDIPAGIRPKSTHWCSYRRLEMVKPCCTLPNVRKAMILHPEFNRVLSIREVARTLGVPDNFIFKGSIESKQQQVANAVAIPLGQAIARVVKEAINRFNEKITQRMGLGYSGVSYINC